MYNRQHELSKSSAASVDIHRRAHGQKLSQSELETAVTSYLEQSWFRLVAADCEECASNERNEGHDNTEARR
jgi:hypothetical protein